MIPTTAARIAFDPLIPTTLLIIGSILVLMLLIAYAWRGGRGWSWRIPAFALVALGLSNPQWIEETREPLTSVAAIVVDTSESMRFGERAAGAAAALQDLSDQIEGLDGIDLRVVDAGSTANGTELFDALASALDDAPSERIAGAILLTDGQAHDVPEDLDALSERFGPVHSLIIGDERERDRRVAFVRAPRYGIVGEEIDFSFVVEDTGGGDALLDVRVEVNGDVVGVFSARPGQVETLPLRLPRRGENVIALRTPSIPEELSLANNEAALIANGVRDKLRVLLITGEPHPGARVWRDLLKSDPSVDLVHFTILRPPHKSDPAPVEELALIGFPPRELFVEKLSSFDLVIFDRYQRRGVLPMAYFENIAEYVEEGGALMISAGPEFARGASLYRTPLAAVLPSRPTGSVTEDAFIAEPTERGARHAVTAPIAETFEADGWGPWYRRVESVSVSGEVLMETAAGEALLTLDRVGDGRVALMLSDQIWLWARGHGGGGPYAELVRRLAHWLMQEPELEEERLSLSVGAGEAIARLRTLETSAPDLRLIDPDGSERRLPWRAEGDGVYTATASAGRLGVYRARAGDLEAVAVSGDEGNRELAALLSTPEILAPVAEASAGAVRRIGEGDQVTTPEVRLVGPRGRAEGGGWIGLRNQGAYSVTDREARPLLPAIGAALAMLLLLLLAWRREGR